MLDRLITFVKEAFDVSKDVGEGCELFPILKQLGQVIGYALGALLVVDQMH